MMTDQHIIHLIRENKHDPAMKRLYAYYPVVKKFILNNHGTRHEAEDIFQEALVIFYNKVHKPEFALTASIHTYLYSVCKLLWLDELKKKSKKIKSDTIPLADHDLVDETTQDIDDDSKSRQAQQAVMKLGQKCKDLLELFYFKKLSMKDIAKTLGFGSEKVAKNQKYRCIEKAKENLKLAHS